MSSLIKTDVVGSLPVLTEDQPPTCDDAARLVNVKAKMAKKTSRLLKKIHIDRDW